MDANVSIRYCEPPQTHLSSRELAAIANYVLRDLNNVNAAVSAQRIEEKKASPVPHLALHAMREGATYTAQAAPSSARD